MREAKHKKLASIEKALKELEEKYPTIYIPYDALLDFWKKVRQIIEEE